MTDYKKMYPHWEEWTDAWDEVEDFTRDDWSSEARGLTRSELELVLTDNVWGTDWKGCCFDELLNRPKEVTKPNLLLPLVLEAIYKAFPDSSPKAGLTLSQLDTLEWYASVIRYNSGTREVFCSVKGSSVDNVLQFIVEELVSSWENATSPISRLKEALKSD